MKHKLLQLYPDHRSEIPLENLYLRDHPVPRESFVYTNFLTSLDGRIAIDHPVTGKRGVPNMITNDQDWRLYQELAARADVLLVSARYIRELVKGEAQDSLPVSAAPEFDDLRQWRLNQGMSAQPAVVILSASLDVPLESVCEIFNRDVYVATGKKSNTTLPNKTRAKIIYAGEQSTVEGKLLIKALSQLGYRQIYSIAGPKVFETLLKDRVLNRLYLTQVHRMIGGKRYDTVFEGNILTPPANFKLETCYYDQGNEGECGQIFGVYDSN